MPIEMKCPGCGAGGRVPRDKANTRLVCKKCLRVFHLTPGGQTVLGEPPVAKEKGKEKVPREPGAEFDLGLDDLTARFSKVKLPKVSRSALGIAAAVILLAGLGYLLFARQSLKQRAELVARSLSNPENMKVAIDLSVPETVVDTIRWYSEASRKYGELKVAMGGIEAGLTINILSAGSPPPAVVVAQFSPEGTRLAGAGVDTFQPTPSLANAPGKVDVHLYFVKDSFGNWLLDGTRTFFDKP
jgi:hypothetical protein